MGATGTLSSASGATRLDDGSRPSAPSEDPTLEISWDEPGRYRLVLTVFDADGNTRSEDVTLEPILAPEQSSTIDIDTDDRSVVVSPDSEAFVRAGSVDHGDFVIGEPSFESCGGIVSYLDLARG